MRGSMHVGRRRRTAAEKPVFVDRTGIRRRWFTTFAAGGAIVLCLAMVGLVAVLSGLGPGVLPALPGGGQVDPKGAVDSTPVPTPSTASSTVDQLPGPGTSSKPPTVMPSPGPTTSDHRNRPTQTPAHPTPSKKK